MFIKEVIIASIQNGSEANAHPEYKVELRVLVGFTMGSTQATQM